MIFLQIFHHMNQYFLIKALNLVIVTICAAKTFCQKTKFKQVKTSSTEEHW